MTPAKSSNNLKKQLYAQLARIGRAAGNGHRLELLEYLAQGEHSVEVLARLAGLTVANTSRHLQALRQAGVISARREGRVTVRDVRPPDEYAAGHLPGAVNIPLPELERQLQTLPREQEIVAYCRGPYCILAYEAVARLRARGFKARGVEGGHPG